MFQSSIECPSKTPLQRVKGVKRKLEDIYTDAAEAQESSKQGRGDPLQHKVSNSIHDSDLNTSCAKRPRNSEADDGQLLHSDNVSYKVGRTEGNDCSMERVLQTVCENTGDNSNTKESTEEKLRTSESLVTRSVEHGRENEVVHRTPLKSGGLLFGHKTPLRSMDHCASPPPLYHSPTVGLPNYVMNPEPRTPQARKVTLTPSQTPDWLTSLRQERGSSVKKEEGDTPVRKVRATPRRSMFVI